MAWQGMALWIAKEDEREGKKRKKRAILAPLVCFPWFGMQPSFLSLVFSPVRLRPADSEQTMGRTRQANLTCRQPRSECLLEVPGTSWMQLGPAVLAGGGDQCRRGVLEIMGSFPAFAFLLPPFCCQE